jgi:hypothetical protein
MVGTRLREEFSVGGEVSLCFFVAKSVLSQSFSWNRQNYITKHCNGWNALTSHGLLRHNAATRCLAAPAYFVVVYNVHSRDAWTT